MNAEAVKTIGVIGLGAWGTALALHLARCGHEVQGWSRSGIAKEEGLPYVVTSDLSVFEQKDIIVLALPSHAISASFPLLERLAPSSLVVCAIKGLYEDGGTPAQTLTTAGIQSERQVVLGGPLFARDLRDEKVASLVAASISEETARTIAALFTAPYLRMYFSKDSLGVELGGVIKNVVALAVGISDGLGLGDAARASLLTRGLVEMIRIGTALGAEPSTLQGLAGLGDLIMTGTCDQSRNRRVGLLLGQGKTTIEALDEVGETAEGVRSAPLLLTLSQARGIDTPITAGVVEVLRGRRKAATLPSLLLARPTKSEFDSGFS